MAKLDARGLWYAEKATGDTALASASSHKNRADNDYIRGVVMGTRWSTYEASENTFTETAITDNLNYAKNGANWTNGAPRASCLTLLMGRYAPAWFFASILANGGNIAYPSFDAGTLFGASVDTLGAAIADGSTTTITVNDLSKYTAGGAAVTSWSILKIESEQMFVTARSGSSGAGTLTVVRGIRGSTAAAHANSTAIFQKQGYRTALPWEVWSGTVTTAINDVDHITAADTTIVVDSTTNFASAGTIRIESEDITYTGKTATSFTGCARGANGTTAAAHNDNTTVTNHTLRGQMLNTLQRMKDQGYDADPYVSAITIFAGTKVEEIILNDDENADADYAGGHNTWTYGGYTQAKHEAAIKQCITDFHRIFTISPLILALNHVPFVSAGDSSDDLTTAYNLNDYVVANYKRRVWPGWTEVDDSIGAPGSTLLADIRATAAEGATVWYDCGTLTAQDSTAANAALAEAAQGGRTAFYRLGFTDIAVRADSIWAGVNNGAFLDYVGSRSSRRRRR